MKTADLSVLATPLETYSILNTVGVQKVIKCAI